MMRRILSCRGAWDSGLGRRDGRGARLEALPAALSAPAKRSVLVRAAAVPLLVLCASAGAARAAESAVPPPGPEARHAGAERAETGPDRPGASGEGQALFEALLRRYASWGGFRARFTERSLSRATGEGPAESGVVAFKRPGRWRWEYRDPERKVVVVRDGVATLEVAGDPEVTRYELGGGPDETGVGSLLEGGEALSARFVASVVPGGRKNETTLRLEPVSLSDEYDHIIVSFARKDLTIHAVTIEDPGGNRLLFSFEEFRPDEKLADSLFEAPRSPGGREP